MYTYIIVLSMVADYLQKSTRLTTYTCRGLHRYGRHAVWWERNVWRTP